MFKNYAPIVLLLLLIQSCTPDDIIEEVEMNNQYKINVQQLQLRESASTDNDSVYSGTEETTDDSGSDEEDDPTTRD